MMTLQVHSSNSPKNPPSICISLNLRNSPIVLLVFHNNSYSVVLSLVFPQKSVVKYKHSAPSHSPKPPLLQNFRKTRLMNENASSKPNLSHNKPPPLIPPQPQHNYHLSSQLPKPIHALTTTNCHQKRWLLVVKKGYATTTTKSSPPNINAKAASFYSSARNHPIIFLISSISLPLSLIRIHHPKKIPP